MNKKKEKTMDMNRREFLEKSACLTAGLGVFCALGPTSVAQESKPDSPVPLKKATLGRTGLEVTVISLGGTALSYSNVVDKAIEAGVNLVHTCAGYTGGENIKAVGESMKKNRDKVYLGLKAHPRSIDKDLAILNTDYVDLILPGIHSVEGVQDPELKASFDKAKEAGKAKFLGFACHRKMAEVLNAAVDTGFYDFALMGYGDQDSDEFKSAIEKARKAGMGIMSMKGIPGHIRKDPELLAAQCKKMLGEGGADVVLASMGALSDVEKYTRIARDKQAAASPSALYAATTREMETLCRMCGKCSECPKGVDICTILRCDRYANNYGDWEMARAVYQTMPKDNRVSNCISCGQCKAKCPYGIASPERLAQIDQMLA